jgi:hypothetical protein
MKRIRKEVWLTKPIAIEGKRKAVKLELPFNRYVEKLIKEDLKKDGVVIEEEKEEGEFHILSQV